jgi:hypothetical protein
VQFWGSPSQFADEESISKAKRYVDLAKRTKDIIHDELSK